MWIQALTALKIPFKVRSTGTIVARCVFHEEKTPSLKMKGDNFMCYGCDRRGSFFDFVNAHVAEPERWIAQLPPPPDPRQLEMFGMCLTKEATTTTSGNMNTIKIPVILPIGTTYQVETLGVLGPAQTLGQDTEAVILADFGGMTLYQTTEGEHVYVRAENEIDRNKVI